MRIVFTGIALVFLCIGNAFTQERTGDEAIAISATPRDSGSHAADPQPDIVAELFDDQGVVGTLVIATSNGKIIHVHNPDRSRVQYSPASTFKIPNTLIALDAVVVESADSQFKWDGVEKGRAAWNQDQTLQSAFRVSCVWCYQEIARAVGENGYASALAAMDYGNQYLGKQVDQFWLNGDLRISAVEQIDFLRKLYNYSLPYERDHIDIVKSIMRDDEQAGYALFSKSGWTGPALHVGWYVGFVEKDDGAWLFAMNFSMDSAEQAGLRKALTIRSLEALGIL